MGESVRRKNSCSGCRSFLSAPALFSWQQLRQPIDDLQLGKLDRVRLDSSRFALGKVSPEAIGRPRPAVLPPWAAPFFCPSASASFASFRATALKRPPRAFASILLPPIDSKTPLRRLASLYVRSDVKRC